ncbi:MAG TPA: cysteine--tRNA ligase, partial [Xanthobacteraceae bacterium]|nr:cysteine--tRNA ligase [Xanthobacteraceae bacterium]
MELKLYDTLTREKRPFKPIDPNNVRMYVCGPTVYDFAHIGNARPVIVFDVLFRLLRHLYGAEHVTYVRNITDVDDKINARAAEEYPGLPLNEAIRKVTEKTDRQFHEDVAALGCLPPTVEPRATDHIPEMRALIEKLVASGNAYVAEDNVLFSVPSMPDYGQLSKRPLDEMIAGARIEVAPYKRDPRDFVLWKPSKLGEPAWPSPVGVKAPGRPGWHIECSAMSWRYLGEVFDIHGGGIDLVFPHHEDEIAQSRCAFHTPVMANYWMHNGFVELEGAKMSKSEGNFISIRNLLHDWLGEVLRFQMLSTHYRQPIDWTTRRSQELENELWEWATLLGTGVYELKLDALDAVSDDIRLIPSKEIIEALSDDLNTPDAITVLRASYKRARDGGNERLVQFMRDCEFLGLLSRDKLGVHSRTVVSTGLVAGYSLEDVRTLRIAVANDLPGLQDKALRNLFAAGFSARVSENGSVSLYPLTDAAKASSRAIEELIVARNAARKV